MTRAWFLQRPPMPRAGRSPWRAVAPILAWSLGLTSVSAAGAAPLEPLAVHLVRMAELEVRLAFEGCPAPDFSPLPSDIQSLTRDAHRVLGRALRRGIWPSAAFRGLARDLAALERHDVPSALGSWRAGEAAVHAADSALAALLSGLGDPALLSDVEGRLEALRLAVCHGEVALVGLVVQAELAFAPGGEPPTREAFREKMRNVALHPEQFLASLLPAHPDYHALVAGFSKYQWVAEQGGWGDWSLEDRLSFDGWRESGSNLSAALRAYQRSVGLEPTGVEDGETMRSLGVSVEDRLLQLRLALQRWRRSAFRRHPTLVWVNLAAAETELWLDGRRDKVFRSLVGSPDDPTPEAERTIHAVHLHPPWFVPKGVERGELDARNQAEPGFYESQGFRVIRDAMGKTRLVQSPGPQNWLGRAILRWSARDAIFIHGSPFEERFALASRALSHGCVNVEHVDGLARALVAHDGGSLAAFEHALDSGLSRRIRLKSEVPAVLDYISVSADEDGRLRFHPDVYGRDERALDALRIEPRTAERSTERPVPQPL